MEDTKQFTIHILGVGSVKVTACTHWQALDKAYNDNSDKQPDRDRYVIGNKGKAA